LVNPKFGKGGVKKGIEKLNNIMRKVRPCSVCKKMTDEFLFNDKMLDIAICSKECEYKYLNTLTPSAKEQIKVLRDINDEIEKTKQHERISWTIAGFGLLIVAIGFLTSNITSFFVGVLPLTVGSLLTSHFEAKRNKQIKLRKQIVI